MADHLSDWHDFRPNDRKTYPKVKSSPVPVALRPTCHLAVERMCQITNPIDGMATLTPEQAKELVDGKWYFNLHTSVNPGGEIRGQILKSE
jgi:hypothetical protein